MRNRLFLLLAVLFVATTLSAQLLIELPKEGGVNVRPKTMRDFDHDGKAPEAQQADTANYRNCLVRGYNALAEKKTSEARDYFENALRLLPDAASNTEVYLVLGKIALDENKVAVARDYFSDVLKRLPSQIEARFWRIVANLQLNLPKEAETDADVLLNNDLLLNNQRIKTLHYRAMAKFMARAYADAQKDMELALQLAPNDTTLTPFYCTILHKNGRSREAFDRLNIHISRLPHDLDALLTRAELYSEDKLYDQALLDYETALKLAPNTPAFYIARARLYLRQGKRAMAKKELNAMAKLPGAVRMSIEMLEK